MRAALVRKEDLKVANLIEWEPGADYDPGPEFVIVPLRPGQFADLGWHYDPEADDFRPPSAARPARSSPAP